MKKIILIFTLITTTQLYAQKYYDKKLHFGVGAAISAGVSFTTKNIDKGYVLGIAAGTMAGLLKEGYDATGRGTPDFYDALATTAGAITTGLVVKAIRKKIMIHKQIKNEKRRIK